MLILALVLAATPGAVRVERDVAFAVRGRITLRMDIHRPAGEGPPRPVTLFLHGGAWRSGRKDQPNPTLEALVRAGFVAASAEYRLSQEAPWPAQLLDVKAAIRWLRAEADRFGIDPERIGVWGPSSGGHLAALAALAGDLGEIERNDPVAPGFSSRVTAAVALFAPTDSIALVEWRTRHEGIRALFLGERSPESQLLGGDPRELRDLARQASPVTWADPDDPPLLLLHGDRDEVVPLEQSRLLAERLPRAELVVLPGLGHELRHDLVAPRILRFFSRHLLGRG